MTEFYTSNPTWEVTFEKLPRNIEELKSLKQADLLKPYEVAALTVAALCAYPADKTACMEMLDYLKGPRPLSPFEKQFLEDRFRGKDYIAKSYFKGARPDNNYEPLVPYTITIEENPYSRTNISEGYLTVYLQSGGADSKRPMKLRKKPSTGQWFLWDQMLLGDIRLPVCRDEWA